MSKIVKMPDGTYADFGTKNQSFLLTAQELKALGHKNWWICLRVKYPQLGVQDIDPYKKNITQEEIGRLHLECKDNIWFWLREVAKVPARGAPKPFDVYLHRAGHAAVWCYEHNIDFMLNQPRQTFKTTIVMLLTLHAFIYDLKNVDIPFMHTEEKNALRNAGMFRDYVETLPPYMNPWYGRPKLPGLKSLKYDEHGTTLTIISKADSAVKAKDKLRGFTVFVAMIDEWEYVEYIDSVLEGATPAMQSGRAIAKQTGARTCVMMLSTPGDLETATGKAAQRMIDKTPPFSENFYDMTEEEIAHMFDGMVNVEGEQQIPVTTVYIEFNYKQLRKDDVWLRKQYAEAASKGRFAEYRRGILLDRFRGSGNEVFKQEDIDFIKNNMREPDYDIFLLKKFHLYVYQHETYMTDLNSDTPYFDINIPYLIGIDISGGSGGDNTTIVVTHPYTLQVCAELKSPYMGVFDLMRVIIELAKIIPSGIFCPETNTIGKALIDWVQESHLEGRFYHDPKLDITQNVTIQEDNRVSLTKKAKNKRYIGINVTPKIREDMMALLKRTMRDYRHLINTKFLVQDICNLVVKKGKIQADEGCHDDIVMAYLQTLYILYYGYDLTRFGLDKKLCTFEKAKDAIKEYEHELAENVVDNTKPYDFPTMYEEQALHDLTRGTTIPVSPFDPIQDRDEYGYRKDQYHQPGLESNPQTLSTADISFFREVNSFW